MQIPLFDRSAVTVSSRPRQ